MQDLIHTDVAIIGAGPIGLEVAIALQKAGIDYVQFDAGQVGQIIYQFPYATRFFSSPERIAIGGIPIQSVDQTKCTREEYLAHLRSVVMHYGLDVRTYERVIHVKREGDQYKVQTQTAAGSHLYLANRIVLSTGGTAEPRSLGIEGEHLPHVSHHLDDPHKYFARKVLVVGGRNSAVEAALRCHHAAAHVAVSYRGEAFPDRVKYWLKPEIEALIRDGELDAMFHTVPVEITPTHVTLRHLDSGEEMFVPADFVLLMVGYESDMSLFRMLGVTLESEQNAPRFDPETMETDVPGVYVAGTATAGTQQRFRVYIENCHVHAERIVAAVQGRREHREERRYALPES